MKKRTEKAVDTEKIDEKYAERDKEENVFDADDVPTKPHLSFDDLLNAKATMAERNDAADDEDEEDSDEDYDDWSGHLGF